MPIYEYECPLCGTFDVIQKMSDAPLTTHAACGSKVKKLMSASSFSFKGSGFYITDYGGKSPSHVRTGEKHAPQAKNDACAACPAKKAS
ncbi:MAG TPA: FmdB family zinc ribbon protein [Anaeromyxobacteraceae bacterium]|nr:FmdB family zinc ribbon protein [Anaeromyxobacteraceae bacterium]